MTYTYTYTYFFRSHRIHKYGSRVSKFTPRKDYKTITVNLKTFLKFVKAAKEARKKDENMNNSIFLNFLLDLNK